MFRLAFVAICSFGFGVALMDTLHEPAPKKARPVAQQAVLGTPIICDATVEQRSKPTEAWSRKCYVARHQR